MNLRNKATGRVMPVDTDGKRVPMFDEVFVGPGHVRVGKRRDEPMRDGEERRLTEEDIVERAEKRRADWELAVSRFWLWMAASVIVLIFAAWLFSLMHKAVK
ncbi:MAG: hypothetical protein NVS9B14_06460 [Candidatus Acidiferrum sp.]